MSGFVACFLAWKSCLSGGADSKFSARAGLLHAYMITEGREDVSGFAAFI